MRHRAQLERTRQELALALAEMDKIGQRTSNTFKGKVLQDWRSLQMISLDRYECQSSPYSMLIFIFDFLLNFLKWCPFLCC
jgi:hypothetical protein